MFTLLRKWTVGSRGLSQFQVNYAGDRILLLDRGEQARLQSFAGCIACGRCDLGERDRILASNGEYPGLMSLVLSSLRNTREIEAAARGWRRVSLEVLGSKEPLCPTKVPFRAIKEFVEAKANQLATANALPTPPSEKP